MLSLRFPIPVDNFLTPVNPRNTLSQSSRTQTHPFRSLPLHERPKPHSHSSHRPRSTTTPDVGLEEEPQELNDGATPSGGSTEEEPFPEGLRRDLMPRHVAVIMDGNGRWAKQRGLPPGAGHEAGVQSLREMIELCGRWGVRVLTVFAFSYDNWIRPSVEVQFLMSLFERVIKSELDSFVGEGIRVSVIGDSSRLPESLQKLISETEEKTKDNSILQLIVAASYSGKYDVVQACKSIAHKVKDEVIQVDDIDESLIEQELETSCTQYPYPDLLIRTSGELRVSNFLLWQLAYTELFFAPALWPDFGKPEFIQALASFQQRQRRFGGRS
ncbi:hypothetical protein FNV43_RR04683 [Rhamnella rubrinervis]|uniref:Alkyl transferase n=1 Tax=Rhamnella rubrinervis TaxID=2594499 RepID=A0A8K0MPT0_9ROSA|nr:hypothetical protein FNV43_RR04683 [Rhamnella rubrinervis]